MSLPDTIFIFVLALIIFGPKKLPEIGRQIGRLVGEFRRASNEFKFQIEEELRQVDLNEKRADRQSIAPATDNSAPSEAQAQSNAATDSVASQELAETLPVGQHPNIDNLDLSALERPDPDTKNAELMPQNSSNDAVESLPETPNVTAAVGSEPRTTIPYAHTEPYAAVLPVEAVAANGMGKAEQPDLTTHQSSGSAEPPTFRDDETPNQGRPGIHASLESADVSRG